MIGQKLLKNDFQWVDVQEPDGKDFERLNQEFSIPYLLVQDCLRPEHLPKYEKSDEGHFLMMRSFDLESQSHHTTVQELTRKIALFFTEDRLITIHRVDLEYLNRVSEKANRSDYPQTLTQLIHQVCLSVIKTYEASVFKLQDLYDDFEKEILARKNEHLSTTRIYQFRRKLFVLKRLTKQTNDVLYQSKDFWRNDQSMLQDLRENLDQLYFQLDNISSNFDHLFELHIALNEQRANDVMKILTIFSTILLPLNFIASFYGMNFTHLPGLHSKWSIFFVIFGMGLITIVAFWYFKRKGWFKTARE